MDNKDDILSTIEEDFEFLDSVDLNGETYFVLIPATDNDEEDSEVFIMRLVEEDDEEALEPVEDDDEFESVYQIFKKNNADEFEFLD